MTAVLPLALAARPAIALNGGAYLASGIVNDGRTRVVRRSTPLLFGLEIGHRSTIDERTDCARIHAATALLDADRSLRAGLLTPFAHEVVWHDVYYAVGSASTARTVTGVSRGCGSR